MNREEWLDKAVDELRPLFAESGYAVPKRVRVSCGFPGGGSARKRIGECWAAKASSEGVNNVFINPTLGDPVQVLATLVHELVHAIDDCESQHKAPFARIAKSVGLAGKMTATFAGPDLEKRLREISKSLGRYPHGALTLSESPTKKQATRMCKCMCEVSGYIVRTTRKWLDEYGAPICPCCGAVMVEEAPKE